MKTYMTLIASFITLTIYSENLYLKNGTIYEDVRIITADPNRMLIAHNNGGCQVRYDELVADTLTEIQQHEIEQKLIAYAELQARQEILAKEREQLRLKKEAFEKEQKAKGLVLFEDEWITPSQKEKIIAFRQEEKIKQQQLRLELAKQKAELEKERLLAKQAEEQLRKQRRYRSRSYNVYYSYPKRSYRNSSYNNCYPRNSKKVVYGYQPKRSYSSSYYRNRNRKCR